MPPSIKPSTFPPPLWDGCEVDWRIGFATKRASISTMEMGGCRPTFASDFSVFVVLKLFAQDAFEQFSRRIPR